MSKIKVVKEHGDRWYAWNKETNAMADIIQTADSFGYSYKEEFRVEQNGKIIEENVKGFKKARALAVSLVK
ncbi:MULTISPECIES: hypothetical protein [Bacillus]|uniref:hypothetical protein n=1 Tax=Bacillus TaxID=1386 RepID=UPI000BFE3FAC|nr:hypothetical protein [Bacillus wiedmannii]PHE70514.1 hypothetical protein COF77_25205 [Bacillus wiedmannii]